MRTLTRLLLFIAFLSGAVPAAAQTLVGSIRPGSEGPYWPSRPATYSPIEACAIKFGGSASGFWTSTSSTSINHLAYVDGYGDTRYFYTPVSETFKQNTTYVYPAFSAWVTDHSYGGPLFYCWRKPANQAPRFPHATFGSKRVGVRTVRATPCA